MSIFDATFRLIDEFNTLSIDYLLVGSLAASYHGLARATVDADFVVQLKGNKLPDIVSRMGPGYRLEQQPGFEIFTGKRIDVIYVLETELKIDVFPLTMDPFDQERFARRLLVQLYGRPAFVPTAEDVIVMKVRWRRPLDLEDARYVIALHAQLIDWAYIERWCDTHGTRQILDEVRRSIPPTE
jgi:hypothetical protein